MKVKSIKMPMKLILDWKKRYGKWGDQKIRELMVDDLASTNWKA
jgi:hypothetical protein